MLQSIRAMCQQYGVSRYGFLPDKTPLERLPHSYYDPWEDIVVNLPERLHSGRAVNDIRRVPQLDTTHLHTEPQWRRAYCVLSFLAHAYVWGDTRPNEILPANIAVPYIEVAKHLGIPPTATNSAVIMWNFQPRPSKLEITNPEDISCPLSFTGTSDEDWFYAVSVAIEAYGGGVIPAMLDCLTAVECKDDLVIVQHLQMFKTVVQDLIGLLQRMNERCHPAVFYNQIRPFLAGGKGMADAGLPRGIFYDEGDGTGSWRQYSGASNGQSALIQFLDVVLGVQHHSQSTSTENYLMEMRHYMRPAHAALLQHTAANNTLRSYATSPATDSAVRHAYEDAVASLIQFRDAHIKIVTRYVLAPARRSPNGAGGGGGGGDSVASLGELKGTGGTNLMQFLKQAREETREVLGVVNQDANG